MRIGLIGKRIATTKSSVAGGGDIFQIYLLRALKEMGHRVFFSVNVPTNWDVIKADLGWVYKPDAELVRSSKKIPERAKLFTQFIPSRPIETLKHVCDITFNSYGDNLFWNVDLSYMHTPYTKEELKTKYERNIFSKTYYRLYSSLDQRMNSKIVTLILTNSHYSERIIKETMGFSPWVLYPPIDTGFYRSALTNVDNRLDHVVTISRFTWEKNLHIIPVLAKRVKNAIFHIAGSVISPESLEVVKFVKRRSSELKVADRVKIHQNPSIRKRLEILSGSKIYINALKEEHFGMAIAEAASAGLAALVPNGGGQLEIVPNQEHVYKDIEEASQLIDEWLSKWSPAKAYQFSHNAEKFSYENFRRNLSMLLTRVAANKNE